MQRIQLDVVVRDGQGKGPARRLRASGSVPGVLYGGGADSIKVAVERIRLERILSTGSNRLVDLKGPKGVNGKLALIKEVQRDPVSHAPVHCDFLAVDTKKKIGVAVPLHFVGKAEGVEQGGVLEPVLREVQVRCLPLSIPDSIQVEVSALRIGAAIHLRELVVPEDVEVEGDPSLTVVHVVVPRVEEVPAAEVPAEGEVAVAAEGEAAAPAAEAEKKPERKAERS